MTKRTFEIVAIASAAAACFAGFAMADRHDGPGGPLGDHGPMIEQFDANGDGAVSSAEVADFKARKFAEADSNNDGALTFEELDAFQEADGPDGHRRGDTPE